MEVCSARSPADAPPHSINININTASHLKVALGWGHIQNIIRDHHTFLARSTAEWMHRLAVVICKIQSSYSTKSYFGQRRKISGWRLAAVWIICCDFSSYTQSAWEGPRRQRQHPLLWRHYHARRDHQITIITVSPHRCLLLTHIIRSTTVCLFFFFNNPPNHHIHRLPSLSQSGCVTRW